MRLLHCLLLIACLFVPGSNPTLLNAQDQETKPEQTDELKVGDAAPDFELESLGDNKVKLSDRFGEKGKPVVLLFSRANW